MGQGGLVLLLLVLSAAPPRNSSGPKGPSPSPIPIMGDVPPPLIKDVVDVSKAFSFKLPEAWTTAPSPTNPNALQAQGDGLIVRFLYQPSEVGYDALHALCMLERLAGEKDTEPRIDYEYDFLSGVIQEREVLDSAFTVKYSAPIGGSQEWRQRNVTIVGKGQSLCVITYAPAKAWKKSMGVRKLLDGIVSSVLFH